MPWLRIWGSHPKSEPSDNRRRYLEDFRKHLKELKKAKPTGASKKERKKDEKRNFMKRKALKILVKYIDHDYATIKKRCACYFPFRFDLY